MTYMFDEPEIPECASCEDAAKDYQILLDINENLISLVKRLSGALHKSAPDHLLPLKAMEYLKKAGIKNAIFREDVE